MSASDQPDFEDHYEAILEALKCHDAHYFSDCMYKDRESDPEYCPQCKALKWMLSNPPKDHQPTRDDERQRLSVAKDILAGLVANPGGPYQRNEANGWGLCNCTREQVVMEALLLTECLIKIAAKSETGDGDTRGDRS